MGRLDEAEQRMRDQMPQYLRLADPIWLVTVAEDYGAVLAELGRHVVAARLLGSADAMRERNGTPRSLAQQNEIREPFGRAQAALGPDTWKRQYEPGRNISVEDALTDAHATMTATGN